MTTMTGRECRDDGSYISCSSVGTGRHFVDALGKQANTVRSMSNGGQNGPMGVIPAIPQHC